MNLNTVISSKKINSIFFLNLIISFILITFYSSIIFFQISSFNIFLCSVVNLSLFLLILRITRRNLFKLDLKINRYELILVIIFIISFLLLFILPHSIAFYYTPYPLLGLELGLPIPGDIGYHISIINSIINFGYPGTNLHDFNFIFYHFLSHYFDSLIIKLSGLNSFESYPLLFYFKFTILLNCISLFIGENLKIITFKRYLIAILFFIPLLLYNFKIFEGSSFSLAFLFILIFFKKISEYIKKDILSHKDLLLINLIILLIFFSKISNGAVFFLITYLLLSKNNLFNKINYKFLFHFLIVTLILFFYSLQFFNETTTGKNFKNLVSYRYLNVEVLIFLKILFLFALNKYFLFKDLNYYSLIFLFASLLIFSLKLILNYDFYEYFLISFDFIFNLFFFKFVINVLLSKSLNHKFNNLEKKIKKISWIINFIFNKISLALLIYLYFIRQAHKNVNHRIKSYLLIIIMSFSSLYYFNGFYLLNFNFKNTKDMFIYYNNFPFTKHTLPTFDYFYSYDSLAVINSYSWVVAPNFGLNNKVLSNKDELSMYRLLIMDSKQKNDLFTKYNRPLSELKKNIHEFIQLNNLDKKKILLFFPKELFDNYFFVNFPNVEKSQFGSFLYAINEIPLINGVYTNQSDSYGFSSYKNDNLFLEYDIFKKNFKCNNKNIIIINNIKSKKFELIKCI